jgi:hypothetical protein
MFSMTYLQPHNAAVRIALACNPTSPRKRGEVKARDGFDDVII